MVACPAVVAHDFYLQVKMGHNLRQHETSTFGSGHTWNPSVLLIYVNVRTQL